MNTLPACVLYTQDATLARRVKAYLHSLALLRLVEQPAKVETVLHQLDPTLLIIDMCSEQSRALLPRIMKDLPDSLVIALTKSRSDPAMEAESLGVYAVEEAEVGRQQLHYLVRRAHAHLKLASELRLMRHEPHKELAAETRPMDRERSSGGLVCMPLHHFSRAVRNFDNVNAMIESIVEAVAGCAKVSRVGLFASPRSGDLYRLRAGIKCLDNAREFEVPETDPLVRWMQIHAHLISRSTLSHAEDPGQRILLEQSLDALGAEVIIPLQGRARLLGWLFVGHRVTGIPFTAADLEELMELGEHVSITVENALLHEEVLVQKTLAETVLHSIPVGIVAVDEDARIRWFNTAAEQILGLPATETVNRPAGSLPNRIAGLLGRCIREGPALEPVEWEDEATSRNLSVLTRRLDDGGRCLGAVAIILDMTREKRLRERQSEIERAAFWAELAAAMSHAVRNPLVAISTFAQLLPERYEDAAFRDQFGTLVAREIGRLNGMIDQLSAFAHPSPLEFAPLRIHPLLERAIQKAKERVPEAKASVDLMADEKLPYVEGDAMALTECFMHVIQNAFEAVSDAKYPAVHVTARAVHDDRGTMCAVTVQDNGRGIPAEILDNIFSPLCTVKIQGIGLGLPIARRIVEDHRGSLTIDTGGRGTSVTVSLPAMSTEARESRESRPAPPFSAKPPVEASAAAFRPAPRASEDADD